MRRFLAAKTSMLNRIEKEKHRNPNSGNISAIVNGELRTIDTKIDLLRWECLDIVEAADKNRIKEELNTIMKDREFHQRSMQNYKELGEEGIITKQEAAEEYETHRMLAKKGQEWAVKLLVALRDAQKEYFDAYNALQLLEEEKI